MTMTLIGSVASSAIRRIWSASVSPGMKKPDAPADVRRELRTPILALLSAIASILFDYAPRPPS
jgi:hypothetical protein